MTRRETTHKKEGGPMIDLKTLELPVEALRKRCKHEDELDFCHTSLDVAPSETVIGQERAMRSMEFGLRMRANGYNIFVVGPPGTGKSTYIQSALNEAATNAEAPDDWCYLYHFDQPERPLAVSMPPGRGAALQKGMQDLVQTLHTALPE